MILNMLNSTKIFIIDLSYFIIDLYNFLWFGLTVHVLKKPKILKVFKVSARV